MNSGSLNFLGVPGLTTNRMPKIEREEETVDSRAMAVWLWRFSFCVVL